MSTFRDQLRALVPPQPSPRRWVYVPYDQLGVFGLLETPPESLGIVMVEDPAKAARRPYHVQKLAFVLASGRHFALEMARRGVAVDHRVAQAPREGDGSPLVATLRLAAQVHGPLEVMRPAERELREELAPLFADGTLREHPHPGWFTTPEDFSAACPRMPFRMDAFYRHVRARLGILMEPDGTPTGGRWSFDEENRRPWKPDLAHPPAPTPPRHDVDAVTAEVGELVRSRFAAHPGTLDLPALPVSQAQAEAHWAWALEHALPWFGPFEDAMHSGSGGLFHARIAHLLNVHRLLPQRVVADVLAREAIPLASREGFVRQVLGWREFVRHVHWATDGFRSTPGYTGSFEGTPLPPAYWGAPSGLSCLDHVVGQVLREGWTHHIPRLMVLANLGTLLGVSPRALTDWFWVAFVDAYDWVVEPNVLAMGTFGVGPVMTTKPYIAGSAYIDRMSDFCKGCAFQPGKSCPVTPMYWAWLQEHAEGLARNPRVAGPVAAARKRGPEDARIARRVRELLAEGKVVTPEGLAPGNGG
jgi:deoxyribodipyrimidine photolyase-related protein